MEERYLNPAKTIYLEIYRIIQVIEVRCEVQIEKKVWLKFFLVYLMNKIKL